MENFKKLIFIFCFLFVFKSEARMMTSKEISAEKSYLFEMIYIAAEIMERNQPIDPNSKVWKQKNIKVLTNINMKNGIVDYTLNKSETNLFLPKTIKNDTKIQISWGVDKDFSSFHFKKNDLKQYSQLKLQVIEEEILKIETAFKTDVYPYIAYRYTITNYPNVVIEFRRFYQNSKPIKFDYPFGFTNIQIYRIKTDK